MGNNWKIMVNDQTGRQRSTLQIETNGNAWQPKNNKNYGVIIDFSPKGE
jgi:hypothetical protein